MNRQFSYLFSFFLGLILMVKTNLQYAEFAKVQFISQAPTTARDVHTKRVRHLASILLLFSCFCTFGLKENVSFSLFFSLLGICAMCGKKVLDTKNYKQTSV